MSPPTLGELVTVADVDTVVRLDGTGRRLLELVLTGDVQHSLTAVLEASAASQPAGAGFFVVGPFGCGKSHFLAAMGELLASPETATADLAGAGWTGPLANLAAGSRRSAVVAVPLIEYRATAPLEDVVAERAWRALAQERPDEGSDRPATWNGFLAAARVAGRDGVVILLDELSEFLRAKQGPELTEDLRFLQFLGEWTRDHPVVILAALQENIEEVANVSQKELARIRDRYQPSLTLSMRHVEDLVQGRLVHLRAGAEVWVDRAWEELAAAYPASQISRERFARCYPLHPDTLSVLEGLRFLLSQQRGVVDFICRRLRDCLARGYGDLITADEVFDHFRGRLHERAETTRLADTVVPYYERALGELVDDDDQSLALRTVKLLCLLAASPLERPRSAAELAAMLLVRVSALDPAANTSYLEQAILEPLVSRGAYIAQGFGKGVSAAYRVVLDADAAVVARSLVAQARSELSTSDRRLVATLVELGSTPTLPLHLLAEVGLSRRDIMWQNTLRSLTVGTVRFLELTADEVAQAVARARTAGAEGCVFIGEVELDSSSDADERARLLVSAGDRVAAWVPDGLQPAERDALLDIHSRRLVLLSAQSEGRADLVDLLGRGTDADEAVAREILRRAYFQGHLRYPHPDAHADLPSLAGLGFERQLGAMADPLLGGLHPRHRDVMPRGELVGERILRDLVTDVILPGRLGAAALARGQLRPWIQGYLVPLGLAKVRSDGVTMAPDPARSVAVAEALRLVGSVFDSGDSVSGLDVVRALADGPIGLTVPEAILVLNACVQAGLIEMRRGRKPFAEPFLAVTATDRFGAGELVEPAVRSAVAAMAEITGSGPFDPWSAATQRRAWDRAQGWLESRREELAEVRAGLVRLSDIAALAGADPGPVLDDLRLVEALIVGCPTGQAAPAGLRRLVATITSLPVDMGLVAANVGIEPWPADLGSGSAGLGSGSAGLGSGSAGLGSGSAGLGSGSVGLGSGSAGLGSGSAGLGSGSAGLGSGSAGLGSGSAGLGSGSAGLASDPAGSAPARLGSLPADVGLPAVRGSGLADLGSGSAGLGSGSVGMAAVSAAARRLGAVARFFRDDLRRIEEAARYLSHPDLTIPDDDQALAARRLAALELLSAALRLAAEDRIGDLFAAYREFRTAYQAAYHEAHDRYYSAVSPDDLDRVRSTPAYRALARLSAIGAVAVPDDRIRVDRLLTGLAPPPCRARLDFELQWKPRCSCRFAIGDREPSLDPAAVEAMAERGVRQYLAELVRPEHRDRLDDARDDLTSLGRVELAADLGQLVAAAASAAARARAVPGSTATGPAATGSAVPVAAPASAASAATSAPPGEARLDAAVLETLVSALDGELPTLLSAVLGGGQLITSRDLATLREDLIGRRYTKRRLIELMAAWADPGGDTPSSAYIEVVDSSDPRSAGGPAAGVSAEFLVGSGGVADERVARDWAGAGGVAGGGVARDWSGAGGVAGEDVVRDWSGAAGVAGEGAARDWAGARAARPGAVSRIRRSGQSRLPLDTPPNAASATTALLAQRFPSVAALLPSHDAADAFWLAAWWAERPLPPSWLPAQLLAEPQRLALAADSALRDAHARAELASLDRRIGPDTVLGDRVAVALDLRGLPAKEVAALLAGERLLRHPLHLAVAEFVRRMAADWQLISYLDGTEPLGSRHALLTEAEAEPLTYLMAAARHLSALERDRPYDCPSLVEHVYPALCAPVPELISRAELAAAHTGIVDSDTIDTFRTAAARLLRAVDADFEADADTHFAGCLRVWEIGDAVVAPLLERHGRVAVLLVDAMRADLAAHATALVAEALPGRAVERRWAVTPAPTRTAEAIAALYLGRQVPAGSAPAHPDHTDVPFAHLGYEAHTLVGADRDDRTSDLRALWADGPPISVAVATGVDERLHRTSVELAALLDEAVMALRRRVLPSLRALPDHVPLVLLADHGFRENLSWGHGPQGRYVHGGTSLEECVIPVVVFGAAAGTNGA